MFVIFRSEKWRAFFKKFLLAIIIFVFGFFLFENLAKIFIHNSWVLKTTPDLSSLKWQIKWELNQIDKQVTEYKMDDYDPILGWTPKKGAENLPNTGGLASFTLDGYRGNHLYPQQKTSGKTRIMIVGDSFTFGDQVNDSETYSAYLEKILPNTEVMNFAVHGYGLDQMLLRLQTQVPIFQPDIIIFGFIQDDMNRTMLSFRDYQKPRFVINAGQLVLSNTPILPPELLKNQIKSRSNILAALELLRDRIIYKNFPAAKVETITLAILQAVSVVANKNQAKLAFLFLPTSSEMTNQKLEPLYAEKILADYCQGKPLICLSARRYFNQATVKGVTYNINRHYEPYVHEIIAKGLAQDLKNLLQNNVASCSAGTN